MPHDPKKLLHDILNAAGRILEWTRGKSLDQYLTDRILSDAVERNFIIIGEALQRLSRLDSKAASALGDYPQIIGFRNVVVHGYDTLDSAIVWGVIQNEILGILKRSQEMLGIMNQ